MNFSSFSPMCLRKQVNLFRRSNANRVAEDGLALALGKFNGDKATLRVCLVGFQCDPFVPGKAKC